MDYQELLFAAEVRKAAVEMYRNQRNLFIGDNARGGPFEQRLVAWEAEHPFEYWFQQAYESIVWAADVVRELRQEKTNPPTSEVPR